MSTPLEKARDALRMAQARLTALESVPDGDVYEPGTILRWRATGHSEAKVAIRGEHAWTVTMLNNRMTWDTLVGMFLSSPLDFFEVAPEDWSDGRVQVNEPQPPVEVSSDGLRLTDPSAGLSWVRMNNRWVLTNTDGG